MNRVKRRTPGEFRWHIVIICAVLVVIVLLALFTEMFRIAEGNVFPPVVWLLGGLVLLGSVVSILSKVFKIHDELAENSAKLEVVAGTLDKQISILKQINQNTRLSEAAKAIACRDADRRALREAVFDKLQQQDFDTTYEIIEEIASTTIYQQLAEQLRAEADKYRDATDSERVNQVIAHIEKLFESYEWAKASSLIERLIKAQPKSEKSSQMRQRLLDKKQDRKKILLAAWDDAVKREATNRSLEILRELDQYLTPNEGLALQEAARDVFRNKLHSLGVQFSLAVSGKQWARAVATGQQIVRDFPNSRMAEEIRERMEILRQKVTEQQQK